MAALWLREVLRAWRPAAVSGSRHAQAKEDHMARDIDIALLRAFTAVVETNSVTGAARAASSPVSGSRCASGASVMRCCHSTMRS